MPSDRAYEVLEIMRYPNIDNPKLGSTFTFRLALLGDQIEVRTVSPLAYERLVKEGLFRGDFVRITEEADGISYEVLEPQEPSGTAFTAEDVYLPFLNDTVIMPDIEIPPLEVLPPRNMPASRERYQTAIGDVITVDAYIAKRASLPIMGRVLYKTRIKTYTFFKKNPFYFQVVLQGSRNLKVRFWGKCSRYHPGLAKGDLIIIQEHRRNRSERCESYLVYNSFHEDLYFNFPEISVNSGMVYKAHLDMPASLMPLNTAINSVVEGRISYMSVLLRHRTKWEPYTSTYESVYEYYLIRVGDCMVVLHSNSTRSFYALETGMSVRLENLRMYMRGGLCLHMSTIYTEIVVLEDGVQEGDGDFVQGALGFIPDKGPSLEVLSEERSEVFQVGKRERSVVIVPLWKPEFIMLRDLDRCAETLVSNETRKYVFRAKMLGYSFSSFSRSSEAARNWTPQDSVSVSYLKNGKTCEQKCALISVGDDSIEKTLLLFKNYFSDDEVLVERAGMCQTLGELSLRINTWFNFVVDVFREGGDGFLICLSQSF